MTDPSRTSARPPEPEEHVGSGLAIAQFIVTVVLLGVVGTLAYLAGLRSSGKEAGEPGKGASTEPAATVDLASLVKPTPELVAKGKTLFAVNCASCHGIDGMGDGPAAAALNPKPRNFHEGYWKYGGGVARVVLTITSGSPGTAMAGFSGIPLEDRFALAHYVRTFSPKPEEDKPEDLAWLGPPGGAPAGGAPAGGTPAGGPAAGPSIPVEMALKLLAEPTAPAGIPASAPPAGGPGAGLYVSRCASCHGVAGEGGIRVRMLGSAPYAYITTKSFAASRGRWIGDAARFEKLVLEGIPGYVMPGNGDLTREEIRQLFDYTSSLRSRQPAAPAGAPGGAPAGTAEADPAGRAGSTPASTRVASQGN